MTRLGKRRVELAFGLLDRPRRQPEIHRLAAVLRWALDFRQGPAQEDRELVGIGRLEPDEPRLRQADQRLDDRLMGAALGRQRHPRRGRHQDEAGILVERIVERVEPALDERVVDRADRQEPRAEQRPRQTERGQLQEQIVLGDAELDVLALRPHRPALRRDDPFLAKGVGALGAIEDAAAIDPGAEIGRHASHRARS